MKKHISWSRFKQSKTYIFIIGLSATIWFLIRVIPKPSRATYPCMQAAAPLMSSFVIYLIGISTSLFSYKKFRHLFNNSRYVLGTLFLAISMLSFAFVFMGNSTKSLAKVLKSTDNTFPVASNDPIGEAKGLFPGRVVWVHDTDATNENYVPKRNSSDYWYSNDNADETVIKNMLATALMEYTNTDNSADAWDAIFKSYNSTHGRGDVGYTAGEKIAFKINLTNQGASSSERPQRMDVAPQLLNAIIGELVENAGVDQSDITMGDPYREFRSEYRTLVKSKYPDVYYVDGAGANGINQTVPTSESVLFFAGADDNGDMHESTLPQHYIDATYMINIPCLKSHDQGGITLIAKNHQGSYLTTSENPKNQYAWKMHYSLPGNSSGTGKYRHTVDYMGHKDTGGKGLLYIIDGIWGGESWQGWINKYTSKPFNNDYPNSIFLGQDPVALESVCFDILFQENVEDDDANISSLDNVGDHPVDFKVEIADVLSQMASSDYWPSGLTYDPENDGTAIGSLGVFEHWNNPDERQYSRNLGTGDGIELVYYNVQVENDPTIRSIYTDIPVTVDGQGDEACWADAEWHVIDQVWLPYGTTMADGDFEGRFKTVWDEDYLYMLFEIVDDSLSDDHVNPLDSWWADDCLEVFIDENRSKGDHECNNNAFAYHVSTYFDAIDLGTDCGGINYKDHVIVDMDTVSDNNYVWEMAFKIYNDTYDHSNPEASRVTLTANKQMGLTVAYCDNDETTGRENFIGSVWVSSANQNNMYKNADLFGEMVLVDPNNPNSAPVITDQVFTVEENPNSGAVIGTVVASDPDGNAINFSIKTTSIEGAVTLNAETGQLTVRNNKLIDYEARTNIDLTVEVSDGLLSDIASVRIDITDVLDTDIKQIPTSNFVVFPNPSSGIFTLRKMDNAISISKVELYNSAGMLMLIKNVDSNSGEQDVSIDLSGNKTGIYFAKIYTNKEVVVKQLSIK